MSQYIKDVQVAMPIAATAIRDLIELTIKECDLKFTDIPIKVPPTPGFLEILINNTRIEIGLCLRETGYDIGPVIDDIAKKINLNEANIKKLLETIGVVSHYGRLYYNALYQKLPIIKQIGDESLYINAMSHQMYIKENVSQRITIFIKAGTIPSFDLEQMKPTNPDN